VVIASKIHGNRGWGLLPRSESQITSEIESNGRDPNFEAGTSNTFSCFEAVMVRGFRVLNVRTKSPFSLVLLDMEASIIGIRPLAFKTLIDHRSYNNIERR
jgi:hypothetical protein